MSSQNPQNFLEIEFKWIIRTPAEWQRLQQKLSQRESVKKRFKVSVTDTYHYSERLPQLVFRHRNDQFLQQLTVKSLYSDAAGEYATDNVVRREVNLELLRECGNQGNAVAAFLQTIDASMAKAELHKEVEVFEEAACEIVLYTASNHLGTVLQCLEIEVTDGRGPEAGREYLEVLAKELDMNSQDREEKSLFELLVRPNLT